MANTKEPQPEAAPSKLTSLQKTIMKAIETKNFEEFKKILNENPKEDINFTDDDKMTPLQQAAYRGNVEMVKILLQRGADVNKCEHANDYTTLHFGALSGNVDVCHLLLAAGVKTNALNSINRTAAQLASFVGYHNIVSTINNFIPKEDIDHYAEPQGAQTIPYLEPAIADNVYKFVLMYNMHPLKIAMLLEAYSLADHIASIKKVLELMSEKEMKAKASNEVLGFKYYYMSYMLGEIRKLVKEKHEKVDKKSFVELFARRILKTNQKGDLEYMDGLLRQCVKSFPYHESTLFRQMVASLTADQQSPTAFSIVSAAVNGQKAFVDESSSCSTCGEDKAMKKCAKCKSVSYCDKDCQKLHWFMHKKMCALLEAHVLKQNEKQRINVDSREISNDLHGILGQENS